MFKAGLFITGGAAMFTLMLQAPWAWAQDYSSSFDPTYAADAESDQVLELPQVAVPEPDQAAASSGDSSGSADQLANGDLNDNQDQAAGAAALAQTAPPLVTPPSSAFAERSNQPYAPVSPPVIIVARPGGLGPFPATSPMLTTPAGSRPVTRLPAVAGGWWQRAHK